MEEEDLAEGMMVDSIQHSPNTALWMSIDNDWSLDYVGKSE